MEIDMLTIEMYSCIILFNDPTLYVIDLIQ